MRKSHGAGRGSNNLRALAQNRGETGSQEPARSATQSPRCSHSGIVQGQAWGFPVVYVKLCKKVFMAEADSGVGYAAVRMKSFFCSFQ